MKSILGTLLAAIVVLAFALSWRLATRDDASFMDREWLFLVASPYNRGVVNIFGESDFSPDSVGQMLAATASEAGAAYAVGAAAEAAARALWRGLRRLTSSA